MACDTATEVAKMNHVIVLVVLQRVLKRSRANVALVLKPQVTRIKTKRRLCRNEILLRFEQKCCSFPLVRHHRLSHTVSLDRYAAVGGAFGRATNSACTCRAF